MIPEKRQLIRDLQPGSAVADLFVLAEAKQGQARNGPFWSLQLQDKSGRIEARIWSPQSQAYDGLSGGTLVYVEGQAQSYREQLQLNVDQLQTIELELACSAPTPVDLSLLIPGSEIPPQELLAQIEALCREELEYPGWKGFVFKVLRQEEIRNRLLRAVGGKTLHHAYVGGLLEHTLGVLRLCRSFCALYPQLDKEVLLSAALFHDLGKAWEIGGGLAADYTDEGRLLGHIQIGLEILDPWLRKAKLEPELVLHFKHLILSHHGEYQWGSPKRPKTAEALALHYADNMDAKMNQFAGIFAAPAGEDEAGEEGGRWSPFQRSLDRYLYKAKPTPGKRTAPRADGKREVQCSLLSKA